MEDLAVLINPARELQNSSAVVVAKLNAAGLELTGSAHRLGSREMDMISVHVAEQIKRILEICKERARLNGHDLDEVIKI